MDFGENPPLVEPLDVGDVSDWSEHELTLLQQGVAIHGLRWRQVANVVVTKDSLECRSKYWSEVRNKRMHERPSTHWSESDVHVLRRAVEKFGNNWKVVSSQFDNRSARECCKKAWKEINAGRMRDPTIGISQVPWTAQERLNLNEALTEGITDWEQIAQQKVITRNAAECKRKINIELQEGRMPYGSDAIVPEFDPEDLNQDFNMDANDNDESGDEDESHQHHHQIQGGYPGNPLVGTPMLLSGQNTAAPPPPPPMGNRAVTTTSSGGRSETMVARSWSVDQVARLHEAVEKYGRNWSSVSEFVFKHTGARWTGKECCRKVWKECKSGRMKEPPGKQAQERWTPDETSRLKAAVEKFGRDWENVRKHVGNRTISEIRNKTMREVAAGRMDEPRKTKRGRGDNGWSETELVIADGLTTMGAVSGGYQGTKRTRRQNAKRNTRQGARAAEAEAANAETANTEASGENAEAAPEASGEKEGEPKDNTQVPKVEPVEVGGSSAQ